ACITGARNLSVGDRTSGGNRDRACLQAEQVNVAAAIQRQAGHLLVFDDVAKLCVGGVYLCGGASDFYSFGNRADHKLEVSSVILVEYEFDSTLNGLFEPFRLDLNAVLSSDRDGKELIV